MSEQELISEMRKLREAIEKSNRQQALHYTFGRGLFSALGATIGLGIVLGIAGYIIGQLIGPRIPALQNQFNNLLLQINQVRK